MNDSARTDAEGSQQSQPVSLSILRPGLPGYGIAIPVAMFGLPAIVFQPLFDNPQDVC
jgi:hypothetical protein